MGCRIIGSGKALPRRVVTNDELAGIVDTSDEWITTRTGISERRIALEETGCDLAQRASERALAKAGVAAGDIDLVICMTITPDDIFPAQACQLKARMGLSHAVAFDLNAACTGCIYGIEVASSMIAASQASLREARLSGGHPVHNVITRALVVGVDRLSRLLDWHDRATCVLFGDGAGAAVIEWSDDRPGILASFLKNTDDDTLSLACAHLYDMSTFPFLDEGDEMTCVGRPASQVAQTAARVEAARAQAEEGGEGAAPVVDETLLDHPFISMQGQHVFKFATFAMVEAVEAVVERSGVPLADVAFIVPHQANERIIRYAAKKLGLALEKFQLSMGRIGNTSASSVLIALDDALEAGRIHAGDKVVLVGFGAGLTSGAIMYEA